MTEQLPCNLAERLADGIFYYPRFLSCSDADDTLAQLRNEVRFTQRSRKLYGRTVDTPRQEAWFGPDASLGAPRDFLLRRKDRTHCRAPSVLPAKLRVELGHGSMLVMLRGVQAEWLHSLPKRPACTEPRVNLTFRDCRPEG